MSPTSKQFHTEHVKQNLGLAAIFSASRLESINAAEGPSLLNQDHVVSALRMRSKMEKTYQITAKLSKTSDKTILN